MPRRYESEEEMDDDTFTQPAQTQTQSRADMPYDPDQLPEEKRAVRRQYRRLNGDESLQNPNAVVIDQLTESVHQADKLFEKVKGPQEATLDSAFLVTASSLGAAKARQMRSDTGGFDIDDFIAKLVTFMGGRKFEQENVDDNEEMEDDTALNWEKIGIRALAKSRRVPTMDFMLGPLSIEQKKRTVTKRAKLNKDAEVERRPEQVNAQDVKSSENETTKNVAKITEILRRQTGPINLFRFIVNPDDFGETVENLFYLSFLIRDAACCLEQDEEGEPVIYLAEAPTIEDYQHPEHPLKKKQMVMELDEETWKRAIEIFDITEPMIPSRPNS